MFSNRFSDFVSDKLFWKKWNKMEKKDMDAFREKHEAIVHINNYKSYPYIPEGADKGVLSDIYPITHTFKENTKEEFDVKCDQSTCVATIVFPKDSKVTFPDINNPKQVWNIEKAFVVDIKCNDKVPTMCKYNFDNPFLNNYVYVGQVMKNTKI